MPNPSTETKERKVYFIAFLIIFLVTCLVTLVFLSTYLYQTILNDYNEGMPEALQGLVGVTLVQVAYGSIAYYKKLFKVNWGKDGETIDQNCKNQAIFEIKPKDPDVWGTDGNFEFKWYNAPYGLAIKELGKMNMHKIKKQNVTYKLLLVEGNDEEGRREFNARFDRMKQFLCYMKEHKVNVKEIFQVAVQKNQRTPSISFYILSKNKKPTAIFYLEPLIKSDGKSQQAFQTSRESVVEFLDHDFEDCWDESQIIDIDNLLKIKKTE